MRKRCCYGNQIAADRKNSRSIQRDSGWPGNSEAVKEIMEELERSGVDGNKINQEIEQLTISTKRSQLRPPK